MASGGYHPPANPAAVSGPGALSRRTDTPQPIMALPNAKYGEQKDLHQIQAGAPMQAPSVLPQGPSGAPSGPPVPPPTPFSAPSTQPNVPVTAGAAAGPGPGPEAIGAPQISSDTRDALKAKYGPVLPALIAETQSQFATQQFKDSVAALISLF
jgi:hypothetical protein